MSGSWRRVLDHLYPAADAPVVSCDIYYTVRAEMEGLLTVRAMFASEKKRGSYPSGVLVRSS